MRTTDPSPRQDLQDGSELRPRLAVPIIVGTRPEAIKMVPVILAMRERDDMQPIVVSTGQHHWMVQEIFDLAGIEPDVTLWAGGGRDLNERVSSTLLRFEDFIREWFGELGDTLEAEAIVLGKRPAALIVHGDTSSAMAAALSAFHLHIPVVHVEAGLRAGGLNLSPFPEELNRQVISRIACLHFAPTPVNLANLVHEQVCVEQIFVTGNTGVDALQWAAGLSVEMPDERLQAIYDSANRVVVVTAHRRESWRHGLDDIAHGVARLARKHPGVQFVVPMHPNPIVRSKLSEPLAGLPNVLLTDAMGYAPFAALLARSYLVITDSGGIQEEAPALGKPVLVTRERTERTEGVDAGTLRLVGTIPEQIFAEGDALLSDPGVHAAMSRQANPYGDGKAADRIVDAMRYLLHGGEPPTPFGSGFSRDSVIRAAGYDQPILPVQDVLDNVRAGRHPLKPQLGPPVADPG